MIISFEMLNRSHDPGTQAFSSIGLANRALFIIWGFFTGLAIYLNMRLLARRLNFKSKWFEVLLIIGCLMIMVTTSIVGSSGEIWDWERIVHLLSALIFGAICISLVITLMIVKIRRKNKKSSVTYLTAILLAFAIFAMSTLYIGWFTANAQILLINVCLVTMFCSNFIERWALPTSA